MTEVIGFCRTCKREWFSHGECHCAECCEHFTSDSGFQLHRRNGECLDPASLKNKRGVSLLSQTRRASGAAWQIFDEREHPWSATA